jgi:hypothetical protein
VELSGGAHYTGRQLDGGQRSNSTCVAPARRVGTRRARTDALRLRGARHRRTRGVRLGTEGALLPDIRRRGLVRAQRRRRPGSQRVLPDDSAAAFGHYGRERHASPLQRPELHRQPPAQRCDARRRSYRWSRALQLPGRGRRGQLHGPQRRRLFDLAGWSEAALNAQLAPADGDAGRRIFDRLKLQWAALSRREKAALALLGLALLAGAVLRWHAIGGDDRLSSDELGYIGDANKLLNLSGYNSFHWAPGTPILFAVSAWLTGHSEISAVTHSHGIAQYAQWIVEFGTLVAAGAVAGRLAGIWAAALAVFALATYGPLIEVTRTYLSEPLGGAMLVAMLAAAGLARRRDWRWLAAAGVVGGLACLAREDFLPGLLVIVVALTLAPRGTRVHAVRRAGVYVAGALIAIAPWVAFASIEQHGLVAITTGGNDSLFIGTYLPGDGSQFQTVEAFKGAVCHRFPKECNSPPGDAGPMFQLITAEHPGDSRSQAVTAAVLSNLRKYALGRPFAFAGLLARQAWGMWSQPWSGGNGTALAPGGVSKTLERIAVALAWLGLLLAAWLYRRSWPVPVAIITFLVIVFFNLWFGPDARDSLRLTPALFTLGAIGLVTAAQRLAAHRTDATRQAPNHHQVPNK